MASLWSIGLITLTEEQVETARKNGIPRTVVYSRVNELGWSIEDAIVKPVRFIRQNKYDPKDVETAKRNGICYNTMVTRLTRGWPMEKAITTPKVKPTGRVFTT